MKSEYNKGYIKLWRSIAQWHWWHDHNTTRVWIVILLNANWEDRMCGGIEVRRGSLLTSYRALAEMTGLSVQETRTAVKHLKETNDITQESTNISTHAPTHRCSLITVVNYDFWQGGYESSTHQSTHELTHESTLNKEDTKNFKEDYKNNSVVDSADLMELLTAEQIQAIYRTYESAGNLIDSVQDQIDSSGTRIKASAYKYICGYADNTNWPTKVEVLT